jgi:hypothetical protein
MNIINFAYDIPPSPPWSEYYVKNIYDDKRYPINGPLEECFYDYHAPIQTVFEKNNVTTKWVPLHQALLRTEKFVYVLTFKYLARSLMAEIPFKYITPKLKHAINTGQCLLVMHDASESYYYDTEFYSSLIQKLNEVSINFKNVLIITGNMANNSHPANLNILNWQMFETAMRLASEHKKISTVDKFSNIEDVKKFLCLNRVNREIRFYFMYQMYTNQLLNDFRASLNKVNTIEEIESHTNNYFINKIKNYDDFSVMLQSLPWIVDIDDFNFNHWDSLDDNFSINNIIFIVTETIFSDFNHLFLTEKIFKPIALCMPFILIGSPKILKHLQSLGYKTFNHIWDESYDDEIDMSARMNKIVDLVKNLSKNYTTAELVTIIKDNNDILEHNYNLLMSRRPEQPVLEFIQNKICK